MVYVAEKAGDPGRVLFPVDEDWSGGDISGTAGIVAKSRVECFEGGVVTATSGVLTVAFVKKISTIQWCPALVDLVRHRQKVH